MTEMKKIRTSKKDESMMIFLLIIIVLILFIVFFAVQAYTRYETLKIHRNYFRQPDIQIQGWMNIRTVVQQFNLSEDVIYSELKINSTISVDTLTINETIYDNRLTIDDACKRSHLNCTQVITRLNSLRPR